VDEREAEELEEGSDWGGTDSGSPGTCLLTTRLTCLLKIVRSGFHK